VVDLDACAPVPDGVDLLDATAVLHDGTTALRILEKTGPEKNEWAALVLGAAGGMGILLVQLLATRGVKVVGAAGGSRNSSSTTTSRNGRRHQLMSNSLPSGSFIPTA
jgi:NADPH:quinone reductase